MTKYIPSGVWQPDFFALNPLFLPVSLTAKPFQQYLGWPKIEEYNTHCRNRAKPIVNYQQIPIKFIEQPTSKQLPFAEQYEPRIYLQGEVATRYANWHDFFNMLVWATFSCSKAIINARQYREFISQQQKGVKERTPLQNFLALLDESGVIVLTNNAKLRSFVENHQWKALFWQYREELKQEMRFFIFGHAIYEKALQPYLGLTAKCILFDVDSDFFTQQLPQQVEIIDDLLLMHLSRLPPTVSPKELLPLPILGIPGWDEANTIESYYENIQYFRSSTIAKMF